MPRKKKLKSDDPEQSARFIETAERIKADNDKELFEKACRKIIRAPTKPVTKAKE